MYHPHAIYRKRAAQIRIDELAAEMYPSEPGPRDCFSEGITFLRTGSAGWEQYYFAASYEENDEMMEMFCSLLEGRTKLKLTAFYSTPDGLVEARANMIEALRQHVSSAQDP